MRVRVAAAGLNPIDLGIAQGGLAAERFGVTPPFINGNDFAGVVDEVGDGVTEWKIGDRVYGGARCAAQVDHLVVSEPQTLNPTPDGLDDVSASVLDIAGRTALAGIRALQLDERDTVLVGAAAGGVGTLACQLALRTGATVVGTASPVNHDALRSLGVVPVAYGTGLIDRIALAAPNGVTAVFDAQGRQTIEIGLALGVETSRINSVADRKRAEAIGAVSVGRASTSTWDVRSIAEEIANGSLLIRIDEVFPVDEVQYAYRRLESGHVRGKLALTFS